MTLPLPSVVGDPVVQANFDAIAKQFPFPLGKFLRLITPGTTKLNWGSGSVTYTASETSATEEIEHGLKATPVWVGIMGEDWSMWKVSSLGETKFSVQGNYYTSISGTQGFKWVAIG